MAPSNLLQLILNGTAPRNIRMLVARGSAPLPSGENLELIVRLLKDNDSEVSSSAARTLASWNKEEIRNCLADRNCPLPVIEHFAGSDKTDPVLHAIITNPAAPAAIIGTLALSVSAHLLEKVLDNRIRLLENPAILESIRKNPQATPEIRRLVQEMEDEFFGDKKKDYAISQSAEAAAIADQLLIESEIPPEELTLEGLPVDAEARRSELDKQIACLTVREKIKYALFGNREIRTVLVRDANKEVAKSVLKSPKLTDSEIEGIAAMREVSEDILREIGNSRRWTKSYLVVQNIVRNPKTPAAVSQRLIPRLRAKDLMQLTRDRGIPEAVRYNATRALNQRTRPPQ